MAAPNKTASKEAQTAAAAAAAGEQGPKNVAERVAGLPLLSSAYDLVTSAYASTKESHPYVRSVCDVAEKGVKSLASAAATGAQPILSKLEPQISTANEYACKGLDTLEEKLPILQQPTQKILSETKERVTSSVTGAKDALSGMMDRTKEAVSGGVEMTRAAVSSGVEMTQSVVSGGVEMTRSTISGGVEMTRSALSSGVHTVGHVVSGSVDAVLGKSEELVDRFLPVTNEELAKLATSMEGFDMERQRAQQSYFVRLGSLSAKVRHRAYEHSLSKLSDAKQSTHDALGQLHQAIELIEQVKQGVDQKLQSGQEKLHQMWLQWRQKQTPEAKQEETPDPKIETQALEVSQGISNQLQTATAALVSNLQGLPAGLQEKVTLIRQHAEDLRTSFGSASSLQDLSTSILAQSREKVTKARELTEELVDHLVHNAPLSWLVGPFTPSSKAEAEEIEME